jgi:hypothetical protein
MGRSGFQQGYSMDRMEGFASGFDGAVLFDLNVVR